MTSAMRSAAETGGTEARRLAALNEMQLLDTADELEYDQLVQLAAEICGTPMSTFTLVAERRQWHKAVVGMMDRENPREVTFCSHAICQDELMEVEDALADERFRESPLVKEAPHIRFYAGMPLAGAAGAHLGTLCVIDTVPRQLTQPQRNALQVLAAQVKTRMEMRLQKRRLEESLAMQETLTRAMRSSEDRFRTFMNSAPVLGFMKDAEGRFVFYNKYLATAFGITAEEWIGKNVHDLFPAEAADHYRRGDLDAIAAGGVVELREDSRGASGEVRRWKSYKFPWVNDRGEMMLGGISVDVTREIEQQELLKRLATVDALTGLANRRPLENVLEREFSLYRRTRNPLSVIMLDLDEFKQRNDTLGHAAGDEVLRKMGRLLRQGTRISDVAGRYGGEEFLLVLPATDWVGAARVAENIRAAMQQEAWPGGALTASFGVATTGPKTQSVNELLAEADRLMYEAKHAHKERRSRSAAAGLTGTGMAPAA